MIVSLDAAGGNAESRAVSVAVPRRWIPVTVTLPVTQSGHSSVGVTITTVARSRTIYADDVSVSNTR